MLLEVTQTTCTYQPKVYSFSRLQSEKCKELWNSEMGLIYAVPAYDPTFFEHVSWGYGWRYSSTRG